MSLGIFGSERTSRSHQILLGVTTAAALVFSLAIGPSGNAAGNSDSASMPAPEQASIVAPEAQGLNVSVEDQTPPEPATPPVPAPPPAPATPSVPVEPPAPVKPPVTTPPPAQAPISSAPTESEPKIDGPAPTVDQSVPGSEDNSDGEQAKPAPEATEPEVEPEEAIDMELLVVGDPFITWEVKDGLGNYVGATSFSVEGPSSSSSNWNGGEAVVDCVVGPCTGADLDPAAGKFKVDTFKNTTFDTSKRYRVQPTVATSGFVFDSPSWKEMKSSDVSWKNPSFNFGTFNMTILPAPVCSAGYVYAISGSGQLQQVVVGGGKTDLGSKADGSDVNGLGIGTGGTNVYAYERTGSGNTRKADIQKYDTGTGEWAYVGASATTSSNTRVSSWVAGGVDLGTGNYYLGGFGSKDNNTVFHIWKYVPGGTSVQYQGYAKVKAGTDGENNGDLAFNSSGDMFIVRGSSSNVMIVSVSAAALSAATGSGEIPAAQSANRTTSMTNVNGIAFDSAGKGYLGNGSNMYSYTMPGWTAQTSVTGSLSDSSDLASCSSPASISVYKNVAGQRVKVGDQFKLKLATPSLATPETALTTGTASGQQIEHIGPLPAARGTVFTISETFENGALAGDYASAWSCKLDGAPFGSGNGTSGSVTIPTSGESVVCEFTNAPLVAHVTLRKEVKGVGQNDWIPRTGWPVGITVAGNPSPVVTPTLPGTQATGADGSTSWKIKFASKTGKANVGVFENAQPNFDFDSGTCTVTKLGGTPTETPILGASGLSFPGIAPGDSVDCTFRNKELPATVVVNKQWVLNGGAPIANQTQPLGLIPALSVNGVDTNWGAIVGPLSPAEDASIGETTKILLEELPTCRLDRSMLSGENIPAEVAITDSAIDVPLNVGANYYMITNYVLCDQSLTLTKKVDNTIDGVPSTVPWQLQSEAWNQGLFATSNIDTLTFNSGETQTVPEGDYDLSEQAKPGYELTDLACEGGELNGTVVTVELGQTVSCAFTNTIAPGSVTWEKQNTVGDLLAGSEWKLNGPDAQVLPITDCTAGTCPGPDMDPVAGKLSLEGLAWGNYSLVETRAPAGYRLNTTPITFVVGPDNTEEAVLLDWDLGVVENEQQDAPTLPLTGGLGTQIFLLIGGTALGIAAGMTAWRRKKGVLKTL